MKTLNSKISIKTVSLEPHTHTTPHNHSEIEVLYIFQGTGILKDNDHIIPLSATKIIRLNPLHTHTITNTSSTQKLIFVTMWWDDFKILNASIPKEKIKAQKNKKLLILPSFPTPNGDLHVGHLAGPYIAADCYKRYHTLLGNSAKMLLGTVGYQTQVALKAQSLNLGFHETAELYTKKIIQTLHASDIYPDTFVQPTDGEEYQKTVKDMFIQLYEKRKVILKEKPTLYCNTCQIYLFEAHATGTCPDCGYAHALTNECEKCANIHEDEQLIEPKCKKCNAPATLKPLLRAFFPLEPYKQKLLYYYKRINLSSRLQVFINKVFHRTLPEIPLSFISKTGINIPLEKIHNQNFFSLFELTARYLSAVKSLNVNPNDWLEICKTHETKLFFGFDNAFLRLLIFPAILMAYNPAIRLPNMMNSNEFYHLYGSKFSTSRDHAIWGRQLIQNYSSDLVRFFLAFTRPEDLITNFKLSDFEQFINNPIKELLHWLHSIETRLTQHFNSRAPEATVWTTESIKYYQTLRESEKSLRRAYSDKYFSTQKICQHLLNIIKTSHCFSEITQDYYETSLVEKAKTCIALELMAARCFATYAAPIIPQTAKIILGILSPTEHIFIPKTTSALKWIEPDVLLKGLREITTLSLDKNEEKHHDH